MLCIILLSQRKHFRCLTPLGTQVGVAKIIAAHGHHERLISIKIPAAAGFDFTDQRGRMLPTPGMTN